MFPNMENTDLFSALQRVYNNGIPEHFPDFSHKDAHGEGWRDNFIYKIPSGNVIVMYDDISDRKKVEEALRESEKRLRTVFELTPDAITLNKYEDLTYVDANRGFVSMSGYEKEAIIGKTPLDANMFQDEGDLEKIISTLKNQGRVNNIEATLRSADGNFKTGLISAVTTLIGDVPHILSITKDITDWKRSEEERIRLEAVEQITEGKEISGT
jgi:PAS domain S-box-containing protein